MRPYALGTELLDDELLIVENLATLPADTQAVQTSFFTIGYWHGRKRRLCVERSLLPCRGRRPLFGFWAANLQRHPVFTRFFRTGHLSEPLVRARDAHVHDATVALSALAHGATGAFARRSGKSARRRRLSRLARPHA